MWPCFCTFGRHLPQRLCSSHAVPREAWHSLVRAPIVREDIAAAARQASVFLERYGSQLPPADRQFLAAYAQIPGRAFFRRKFDVLRMQLLAENGFVQNVGILLRA